MSTPHYIAQKFGDHYVLVRQDLPGAASQSKLLLGGAAAAALGLSIGGRLRWLLLAGAAGLVAAGLRHTRATPPSRGRASPQHGPSFPAERHTLRPGQQPQDAVDEAAMESFPASDSPAM